MPLLDPHLIARTARLDLKAKLAVEGLIAGMHRSPFKGFSVEFAQHRGYVPGDDLRHLDWKAWGRNERYYIKQYEAETNLIVTILVDASASMAYGGAKASGRITKFAFAQLLAATLSHLILGQSDAVAVGVFNGQGTEFAERSTRKGHIHRICALLEGARPQGASGVAGTIHGFAERSPRRGLAVLVSDLFDDVDRMLAAFRRLRHGGHEMVVFNVLDPDELEFPFEGMAQFRGLEDLSRVKCHPRSVRSAYLDELHRHLDRIRAACLRDDIDFVPARTDRPVDVVLSAYLAQRERRSGAGARMVRA